MIKTLYAVKMDGDYSSLGDVTAYEVLKETYMAYTINVFVGLTAKEITIFKVNMRYLYHSFFVTQAEALKAAKKVLSQAIAGRTAEIKKRETENEILKQRLNITRKRIKEAQE